MATDRLQKILARAGIASRRAAEEYITSGRVRVNGRIVRELGTKADARQDRIEVDGDRIIAERPAYVLLHKPRGVVSTMSDPEGRPTVKEILAHVPVRVFPIGRLDFATSGVLLATNDGDFAEGLMHPRKAVPKTYVLKVNGLMKPEDLDRWRQGVQLEDGLTLPAEAKMLRHEEGKTWIELTIREGRNQQIRRMGEATGFRVMRLARISFAGISSEGVRPGDWRLLTRDELQELKKTFGVPQRIPHIEEPVKQDAPRPAKNVRNTRDARHTRNVRDTRGPKETRDTRDTRAPTTGRGAPSAAPRPRGRNDRPRGAEQPRDTRAPREVRENVRDSRGPRETTGGRGAPSPVPRPRGRSDGERGPRGRRP